MVGSALVRTRFAPSPTGKLHLGNVRTALFNWLLARQHDGAFVLRIEDTDQQRSTPEAEADIIQDLRWLGIDWDEGPDRGGAYEPYRQSERLARYVDAVERLKQSAHLYPCFCTAETLETARQEMARKGIAPRYAGVCRRLSEEERAAKLAEGLPHALRFTVPHGRIVWDDLVHGPQQVEGAALGDFIIQRSDGSATYNLAVVVDDIDMAISHVVRGDDHLANTPRQLLLSAALGAQPPRYGHVPLLVDADQRPLSKRDSSSSVASLRQRGYLAAALRNFLALLGWSHPDGEEVLDNEALLARFDLGRVRRGPATVAWQKLQWLNAIYVRQLPAPLMRQAVDAFNAAASERLPRNGAWQVFLEAVRGNSETLEDLVAWWRIVEPEPLRLSPEARASLQEEPARTLLETLRDSLREGDATACEEFGALIRQLGKQLGIKGKALYAPVRLALTGREHGPELAAFAPILGRALALQRIEEALRDEE